MSTDSATSPPRDMPPAGWGDPARRPGLSPQARQWLATEVGLRGGHAPPVPPEEIPLPDAALPPGALQELAEAVGAAHVSTERDDRLRHAGGKSYLDLVRRRRGIVPAAPDAVVTPGTHDEVLAVLRTCSRLDIAVVPFGGGTSVVGGVEALPGSHRAVVSLDLRRFDRVHAVDTESLTATVGPGLRGPEAEQVLAARGLTLDHSPQSWEHATLGGYAATRSAAHASAGHGRFDDLVLGLRLATPAGTLRVGRGPASAAGPNLRALVLGSEGVFGVITELTVRVRPISEASYDEGWSFRTFDEGVTALRRLAQAGLAPDVARLSDPEETRTMQVLGAPPRNLLVRSAQAVRAHRDGCLLVVGWEGAEATVVDRQAAAGSVLRACGGSRVGAAAAADWRRRRFLVPYLRDDLLDAGMLMETLETATTWSDLTGLYEALRSALRHTLHSGPGSDRAGGMVEPDGAGPDGAGPDAAGGTAAGSAGPAGPAPQPIVMAHVSHVYPTGASLFVTVLAERDDDAPEEQWLRAKRVATEVITASGATVTHHHAVGTDHRPWMREEVGELGVEVLRAVKGVLDPAGVLNPGKLLPDGEA